MDLTKLLDRAKNLVLTPAAEWQRIDGESANPADIYPNYVIPFSIVGPVAHFLGALLFMGRHISLGWALSQMVLHFVLSVFGVFLLSQIITLLAPSFGATRNPGQSLKVAAYAFTPAWVAGVLNLLPPLGLLALLASLYSLYVLYLGLPKLMKAPPERGLAYTVTVVICAIVVMAVLSRLVFALRF